MTRGAERSSESEGFSAPRVTAATVTLTALQARRAMQLAMWMARQTRDEATKRRCRDLAYALDKALLAALEPRQYDEYRERRRAEWRAAAKAHRERKQQQGAS